MSLISSVENLPKQQSLDGVENDVFQMPINETTTTHPQMVGLWCPGIPDIFFEILASNMHKNIVKYWKEFQWYSMSPKTYCAFPDTT
jgi:hypothetical protein